MTASLDEQQTVLAELRRNQPWMATLVDLANRVGMDPDDVYEAFEELRATTGVVVEVDLGIGQPVYCLEWGVKAPWEHN